jgi:hypothetical protein
LEILNTRIGDEKDFKFCLQGLFRELQNVTNLAKSVKVTTHAWKNASKFHTWCHILSHFANLWISPKCEIYTQSFNFHTFSYDAKVTLSSLNTACNNFDSSNCFDFGARGYRTNHNPHTKNQIVLFLTFLKGFLKIQNQKLKTNLPCMIFIKISCNVCKKIKISTWCPHDDLKSLV